MTERQLVTKILQAFDADEDLQESIRALDADVADWREVGDDAARSHAIWLQIVTAVKDFERQAQKRAMIYLSPEPKRAA